MMHPFILEEASSSTSTVGCGDGGSGGRAIDRHNPIIQDEKRFHRPLIVSTSTTTTTTVTSNHPLHHKKKKNPKETKNDDEKRKSIAFADKDDNYNDNDSDDGEYINIENISTMRNSSYSISPSTSSRYLLSNKAMLNISSEFKPIVKIAPAPPLQPPPRPLESHSGKGLKKKDDGLVFYDPSPPSPPPQLPLTSERDDFVFYAPPPLPPPPPSPPSPREALKSHRGKGLKKNDDDLMASKPPSPDKVVVLEVSLHCRGCERKVKKHISKIQGVKSFKIEFTAEKITVIGDVTPLTVLTNVLKVKNVKLLNPSTISSSFGSLSTDSNFSESKKLGIVV